MCVYSQPNDKGEVELIALNNTLCQRKSFCHQSVYLFGSTYSIWDRDNYYQISAILFKYCPMCGEKLAPIEFIF